DIFILTLGTSLQKLDKEDAGENAS
ncbi:hypothetical protein A2U01_0062713, partial [Trifolium medium]|nr:hypothetical protein [Trifolium medium]